MVPAGWLWRLLELIGQRFEPYGFPDTEEERGG